MKKLHIQKEATLQKTRYRAFFRVEAPIGLVSSGPPTGGAPPAQVLTQPGSSQVTEGRFSTDLQFNNRTIHARVSAAGGRNPRRDYAALNFCFKTKR